MEQNNVSRRGLIGAAIGTGAAAALTPSVALGQGGGGGGGGNGRVPRNRRGIQLYTMRRLMQNQAGARNVLRQLGRMGYAVVQTAGHYEWTADEFKRELDRAGLKAVSGHDGPGFPAEPGWEDGYRETLEYAAELGQEHTGLAFFGSSEAYPYTSEDTWRALAAHLNAAGEIAWREFGLQFFYHNHDFEFTNQFNGRPAYDILLNETSRRFVRFELDLYWITEGGGNAVTYLSADPRRYISYHVKDHVWGDRPGSPDWEDAGPGMLDFPDLFDAGDRSEKYYFIEHDQPTLSHPTDPEAEITTAKAGIRYLEEVRW